MPLRFLDRVQMSVSGTPGTGTITLGSAQTGFQSFAAAGINDQDTCPYVIVDGSNWEYGVGTYTASGTTLARTTISGSSNSGSAISATSSAIVSCSLRGEDIVALRNQPPTTTTFGTTVTASGTTTGTTYTDGVALTFNRTDAGSNNTDAASFLGAAVPGSTPWTVRMQVRANILQGANNRAGMGIYNSSSGKLILFGMSAASGSPYLVGIYYANLTTLTTSLVSQSLNGQPIPEWLKITFDGTTYSFYFSYDNVKWYLGCTATAASYFTATHVGLAIESYNAPWLAMGVSCLNYLVP